MVMEQRVAALEAGFGDVLPIDSHYSFDESLLYDQYQSEPPIEVRNGCVLIPIAFAVWWYWTRRAAKRAVRLLLTSGGSNSCFPQESDVADDDADPSVDMPSEMDDVENRVPVQSNYDKFDSWDDVMAQESSSAHLVRWITFNGRRKAKRRMRAVTKSVMMNRSSCDPTIHFSTQRQQQHQQQNPDESQPNCEGLLDDALSSSGCSHWECIDDTVIEVSAPRSLADDASQHSHGIT